MKFSSMLAKKYIFTQKRHSLLTILSIAAAVTLITVIFNIFSTYWVSMAGIAEYEDPWHATVVGLTREQVQQLVEMDEIEHYRYTEKNYGITDKDGKPIIKREALLIYDKKAYDPDTSLIACIEKMGFYTTREEWNFGDPETISVHVNKTLLQYQLIGLDAKYSAIQMVALLYVFVLFIVLCARFVIDTAFEISSKEREKQFGILRSLGASKKQIVRILLCEGGYLSIVGIPLGLIFGTGLGYVIYKLVLSSGVMINLTQSEELARRLVKYNISPLLMLLTAATGLVWALLSAYGTGMRAAKMSPIEAMRSRGTVVTKIKRRTFIGILFGWAGKLASRNIRRGKKRFIVTVLSIMLSITLFVTCSFMIGLVRSLIENSITTLPFDVNISVYESDYPDPNDPDYVKPKKSDFMKYMNKLESCGLFKNVRPNLEVYAYAVLDDESEEDGPSHRNNGAEIFFVTEETYARMMGDDPEIPYSRLAEEDGFILIQNDGNDHASIPVVNDPCILKMKKWEFLDEPIEIEDINGEKRLEYRDLTAEYTEEVNILKVFEEYSESFRALGYEPYGSMLIGSLDQFDKWEKYSTSLYYTNFYLDLADGVTYNQVQEFVRNNDYEIFMDMYGERVKLERIISAAEIFAYALTALIGVIAIINMVNIISTSIINRRSELAAMKSLGMNRFQLYKMLLLECFGYVSLAGSISAVLGCIMFFGTASYVSAIGFWDYQTTWDLLGHGKALLEIPLLMLAAFAVGVIATAIPVRSINKGSITESMRMVD